MCVFVCLCLLFPLILYLFVASHENLKTFLFLSCVKSCFNGLLVNFLFYMISFVVGTLLTSTGIGGPLMAVAGLSKNWTKNEIRGSLSLYYIFVEGAAVIGYLYTGSFEREVSLLVLVGLFPSICGFLIASYLVNKSTEEVYKKALLGVIILSGIVAFLTQTASFLNISVSYTHLTLPTKA